MATDRSAAICYEGEFQLAWLGHGERVMSAGDGTGAAIIVASDGSERRVEIGDEVRTSAREAEGSGLLSRPAGDRRAGSNPASSASELQPSDKRGGSCPPPEQASSEAAGYSSRPDPTDARATGSSAALLFGYADPPYPGCAHLYRDHPDYAGEVDHEELIRRLDAEFDGWCLHTSSVALGDVLGLAASLGVSGFRVMAWVKPFAAFKRNVSVAYAWKPVLVKQGRKPVVKPGMVYRDWIAESITLKKGLTGAKPWKVCAWLFEVMGMERQDALDDLFPGTGAVTEAWQAWRSQPELPLYEEVVA